MSWHWPETSTDWGLICDGFGALLLGLDVFSKTIFRRIDAKLADTKESSRILSSATNDFKAFFSSPFPIIYVITVFILMLHFELAAEWEKITTFGKVVVLIFPFAFFILCIKLETLRKFDLATTTQNSKVITYIQAVIGSFLAIYVVFIFIPPFFDFIFGKFTLERWTNYVTNIILTKSFLFFSIFSSFVLLALLSITFAFIVHIIGGLLWATLFTMSKSYAFFSKHCNSPVRVLGFLSLGTGFALQYYGQLP